jgi:uncharacterized heparinase superfamily protein
MSLVRAASGALAGVMPIVSGPVSVRESRREKREADPLPVQHDGYGRYLSVMMAAALGVS